MSRRSSVALSLLSVMSSLFLGGLLGPVRQGRATKIWYQKLEKPPFTPPPYVFALIWPLLSLGIIDHGARVLHAPPSRRRKIGVVVWIITVAGLSVFPFTAFRKRALGAAAAVSWTMLLAVTVEMFIDDRCGTKFTRLIRPLWAWLGFATWLQMSLRRRNR